MNLNTKIPARTVMAKLRKRSVFNFWVGDDEHPSVFIAGVTSIEDAEQSLQATFGGRVSRVERLIR